MNTHKERKKEIPKDAASQFTFEKECYSSWSPKAIHHECLNKTQKRSKYSIFHSIGLENVNNSCWLSGAVNRKNYLHSRHHCRL